jgi:hypothetical protein
MHAHLLARNHCPLATSKKGPKEYDHTHTHIYIYIYASQLYILVHQPVPPHGLTLYFNY